VVDDAARARALTTVTEALLPGRSAEVRASTPREVAATLLLAMPIGQWSMKVSQGWPADGPDDIAGPAWAGIVPIHTAYGAPQAAPDLGPGRPVPASVGKLVGSQPAR
jgi:hypothetical protein